MMAPVASGTLSEAPAGLLSLTTKVSVGSKKSSSSRVTVIVLDISPGPKVRVPPPAS